MGSKLEALPPPITATDPEGRIIPCVTHRIVPVTLIILRNNVVNVSLSAHKIPLVLGYQLLHFHNPQIDPQTEVMERQCLEAHMVSLSILSLPFPLAMVLLPQISCQRTLTSQGSPGSYGVI